MVHLLYVAVTPTYNNTVQVEIERYCAETEGTQLISRSDHNSEILHVIRLQHNFYPGKLMQFLTLALREHRILSFQFEATNLVKVACRSTLNIKDLMHEFPLQLGEAWFPAVSDTHTAHICTYRNLMAPTQVNWLKERDLDYCYN